MSPDVTRAPGRRSVNRSFTGNRDHHVTLDVHAGERGEPVWIPRRAGR